MKLIKSEDDLIKVTEKYGYPRSYKDILLPHKNVRPDEDLFISKI